MYDKTQEDRAGFVKSNINNVSEFILDDTFTSSELNSYNITGANEYASGIGDNGEFFTDEKAEIHIKTEGKPATTSGPGQ